MQRLLDRVITFVNLEQCPHPYENITFAKLLAIS